MRAQPASELVWRLANAGFAARCLQVVAELGVADRIDEAPVPVAALASSCAVDIDALDRILRLLAVHGCSSATPIVMDTRPRHGCFVATRRARCVRMPG